MDKNPVGNGEDFIRLCGPPVEPPAHGSWKQAPAVAPTKVAHEDLTDEQRATLEAFRRAETKRREEAAKTSWTETPTGAALESVAAQARQIEDAMDPAEVKRIVRRADKFSRFMMRQTPDRWDSLARGYLLLQRRLHVSRPQRTPGIPHAGSTRTPRGRRTAHSSRARSPGRSDDGEPHHVGPRGRR